MESPDAVYFSNRKEWRQWLQEHFDQKKEIWLAYPKKASGKPRIVYNDAVEEALCFGWIDSTVKSLDETFTIQRFTPRNPKSSYSQANKERLKWLANEKLLLPSVEAKVKDLLVEDFNFPADIIAAIKNDKVAYQNYLGFSDGYKRIRIAFINAGRKRPEEFEKRLNNFISKTRDDKLIKGFGGIDKYY